MYTQPSDETTSSSCRSCHLRLDACLCASRPTLTSSVQFFLLVHERELSRPTNTGHLVAQALPNTLQAVWMRRQPPINLLNEIQSQRPVYLAFPIDQTQTSTVPSLPLSNVLLANVLLANVLLVLLDATWQEARKMVRQSPYLRQLPVLSLAPTRPSSYTLRRHQSPGHLSTAEAVTEVLAQSGDTIQSEMFATYYHRFLTHFQASRCGHGYSIQHEFS